MELLGRADTATRKRRVEDLQGQVGNRATTQLVSGMTAQRDPAPGPPAPAVVPAPKTTWLRPLPSTLPRITPPTTDFDRVASTASGHPYVDSVPTATPEEQQVVAHANDYFESSPLELWESASDAGPEYQAERDKLTDLFQQKAYRLVLFTLVQSEKQAWAEREHYAPVNGVVPEAVGQFTVAAQHLAEVQNAVLDLANLQNRMYEQGPLTDAQHLDQYFEKSPFEPVAAADKPGGDTSFAEATRQAMVQWPLAVQKYKNLREVYGAEFPVLLAEGQDYAQLAKADATTVDAYARAQTTEVLDSIQRARHELSLEKIWSLPIVIAQTKQLLGIPEGTGANDAIEGKLGDLAWDATFHKLAMAALQLGLGVVAGVLTGGAALVVGAASAAVGVTQAAEEYQNIKFGRAMSGRIALDTATRLSSDDPGYFWLALTIAGVVLDAGMAAMAFRSLVGPLKAACALADSTQGVRLLTAGEQASATTATTLADVEEILRAEARVLASEGKLAEGMTEELFVQRVMTGLRRQVLSQGKIAEAQAGVIGSVVGKTHPQYAALLAGDRAALTTLLTEHGEWKSLVTALDRSGQTQIAQHLLSERGRVIGEIQAEVRSLSTERVPATVTPMQGGSTELASDVDLQIQGANAGQMMIDAEAYMARRFGPGWSSMFRLNFYTEGGRLTRYQEVLASLRPVDRVRLTKRITAQTERFTFAKMLMHAGDDPVAIGRVEELAQQARVDLTELRPLSKLDDAARSTARNTLLQEVDKLQAEYVSATGARRIELAEQISSKQLEANFYTYEANIGPGSLTLSGSVGLELQESYQAALSQLEMIEHIMAEAGGDVARASREYELFKYIGRFGEIAEKASKDSDKLRFLRNQAKVVAGGQRELMEETAHEFVDVGKIRGGGRPADLPQHVGPSTPVTDDFLEANFRMFTEEASDTLTRLNPSAARRTPVPTPTAGPLPRSQRPTAPINVVPDAEAAAGAGPRIINRSTSERYYVQDAADARFRAEGHLEHGGELSITMRTESGGARSQVLRGREEFDAIVDHFEGRVTSIRGAWNFETNLDGFNKLVREGKSEEDAARGTWTGQQAGRHGFTKVSFTRRYGQPGHYTQVTAVFRP